MIDKYFLGSIFLDVVEIRPLSRPGPELRKLTAIHAVCVDYDEALLRMSEDSVSITVSTLPEPMISLRTFPGPTDGSWSTREELLAAGLITNIDDYSLYNGFTCNIRTEALTHRQLNNAIFWNGLRLYFNPAYLADSRFWHYRLSSIPALFANNVNYLTGAAMGRIFASRHTW